jgi:catechol 2,3-dioxygenase-like lactoylglutathione lyase family enzyme
MERLDRLKLPLIPSPGVRTRMFANDWKDETRESAVADRPAGTGRLAPRGPNLVTIEHMAIQRMEHVGIVVDDLAAATEFFVELGLVLQGEGPVEGRWVDRVVGLEGVRADIAIMQTPDGNGRLELTKFHSPSNQGDNRHAPANTPGIRHVAFAVEDIDAVVAGLRARGAELVGELERYEDSYRLCYVRGPEGIIIELAEQIG